MSEKTLFDKSAEIIEDTEDARDEYGHAYGSGEFHLTDRHIQALMIGKCIAITDEEYVTFITLSD